MEIRLRAIYSILPELLERLSWLWENLKRTYIAPISTCGYIYVYLASLLLSVHNETMSTISSTEKRNLTLFLLYFHFYYEVFLNVIQMCNIFLLRPIFQYIPTVMKRLAFVFYHTLLKEVFRTSASISDVRRAWKISLFSLQEKSGNENQWPFLDPSENSGYRAKMLPWSWERQVVRQLELKPSLTKEGALCVNRRTLEC